MKFYFLLSILLFTQETYSQRMDQLLESNFDICYDEIKVSLNPLFLDDKLNYSNDGVSFVLYTDYCNDDISIKKYDLIDEGIYGFQYYLFEDVSFDEVVRVVELAYGLSIKNSTYKSSNEGWDLKIQKTIDNNQSTIDIAQLYNGYPDGDYIRIIDRSDGYLIVHTSYNGI